MRNLRETRPREESAQKLGSASGKNNPSLGFSYLIPLDDFIPIPPPRPKTNPRANAPLHDTSSLLHVRLVIERGSMDSLPMQPIYLKSALSDSSIVETLSADIATQVANGRTRGPFTAPLFDTFDASPIGAVSRKRSSMIRRIHYLSWPEGSSVNDGIPDAEATIVYDIVKHAINDLIAFGPGSQMLKLDLESAFHHVHVHHAGWLLLGFEWLASLYYNIVLALVHAWCHTSSTCLQKPCTGFSSRTFQPHSPCAHVQIIGMGA
ncbi:hypothetical protein E4T56_gene2659 [Termitomyces sp. T112]|nr:hypothetical protein E4T56_gene2659 [Termitomyces sp. T112]